MTRPWVPARSSAKSTCTVSNRTNRNHWRTNRPFDDDLALNALSGLALMLEEERFELFSEQRGRLLASLRVGMQPMRPFGWQLRSSFREKNREGSDEQGQR